MAKRKKKRQIKQSKNPHKLTKLILTIHQIGGTCTELYLLIIQHNLHVSTQLCAIDLSKH